VTQPFALGAERGLGTGFEALRRLD